MAYLHGTFKDIDLNTIGVEINSSSGNGEIEIGKSDASNVFFSSDPVHINFEAEDLFSVILKKSAKISLVSKIYLGDILFAGKPTDVSVVITKNDKVLFDGYVEPNSFNQPWAYQIEEFEINCVDKLSVLMYNYWTDSDSYYDLLDDVNNYSFKQYLQKIGLDDFNVFYDNSKNISGSSVWDTCGLSMNVFLGSSKDEVMNYEDILENILKYLNLHIIQEGSDLYIFDWSSIVNNSISWMPLFGSGNPSVTAGNISVDKDMYSDSSSSLSMDEVYNQIQIKCNIESVKEVISSFLDEGDLENIYPGRQLCMTEAWYDGGVEYKSAAKFFQNSGMLSDSDSNSVAADDPKAWHVRDWYMKWLTNPKWTLHYKNSVIESFVPYVGSNKAYQNNLLKLLYQNKFMPAFISIGCSNEIKNGVARRTGSPEMHNYLVISGCAGMGYTDQQNNKYYDGTYNSYDELITAINSERIAASGSTGLVSYDSGTALNASPIDDTTNYIIIKGSIILEPVHWKCGYGTGGKTSTGENAPSLKSGDNVSWGKVKEWLQYSDHKYFGGHNYYSYQEGILGHYEQIPWTAKVYNDTPEADIDTNAVYLSPPVNKRGIPTNWLRDRLRYNKSKTTDGWSDEDTINKISVLECELKIGDKYCVEDIENLDVYGCPTFHWYTAEECETNGFPEKSFTIGFNPSIGDLVVGKEYPLTNTVDGRKIEKSQGMAIPIKKEDNLSGNVTFKIKGVLDLTWNTYFERKPGWLTISGINIEGTQHLWYEIASLWIKDFGLEFISDNNGAEPTNNNSDIIYMSAQSHDYIKKKDDIEFNINTQLTSEESAAAGLDSSIAYSNVINLTANSALENITSYNGTNKPEKLYIDQYWNFYNIPKVIMNTQLYDNNYSIFNTFTFKGFGKMLPFGMEHNLKYGVTDIKCRQV